jgi:protein O-mannosyl-transferase
MSWWVVGMPITESGSATARRPAADLVAALALFGLTLIVFSPALGHGWLDYDDDRNFLNNPHYRGLGPAQLRFMFTGVIMGHWTPVTWLTLGFDYVLWGMNPLGYHLGNVLLHAGNAAIFFVIARRLLVAARPGANAAALRLGAVTAAAVFALHPLRAESVAWITERRDVLSACFYLLAVLTYLRSVRAPGWPAATGDRDLRWYLVSIGLFTLGLLSKSMLVSLPFVLLILDVYPLRRLAGAGWWSPRARALVVEKLPYLGLAIAAVVWTSVAMAGSVRVTPLSFYPPLSRVAMAVYSLAFFPWKTLVPLDLIPMYELPVRVSLWQPPFVTALLAVTVVTVALLLARHRWPGGLAVWLAYAITLAPVSGLIHAGPQLVADRFGYLPSLGLCLLPGAGATIAFAQPAVRRVAMAGVTVWILALAALTWSQVQVWRDTDTLFVYTLEIAPDCAWCHHQYGGSLGNRGQLEPAITHFSRAATLLPDRVVYQHHLGLALLKAGRPAEALPHLQRTVAAQAWNLDAATQLGLALVALDRPAEAVPYLERVTAARPGSAEARQALDQAQRAARK